eukprot:sb/3461109/
MTDVTPKVEEVLETVDQVTHKIEEVLENVTEITPEVGEVLEPAAEVVETFIEPVAEPFEKSDPVVEPVSPLVELELVPEEKTETKEIEEVQPLEVVEPVFVSEPKPVLEPEPELIPLIPVVAEEVEVVVEVPEPVILEPEQVSVEVEPQPTEEEKPVLDQIFTFISDILGPSEDTPLEPEPVPAVVPEPLVEPTPAVELEPAPVESVEPEVVISPVVEETIEAPAVEQPVTPVEQPVTVIPEPVAQPVTPVVEPVVDREERLSESLFGQFKKQEVEKVIMDAKLEGAKSQAKIDAEVISSSLNNERMRWRNKFTVIEENLQRKKVDLIAAYEEEVVGITSKLRSPVENEVCKDQVGDIIQCYQSNPTEVLRCQELTVSFDQCVSNALAPPSRSIPAPTPGKKHLLFQFGLLSEFLDIGGRLKQGYICSPPAPLPSQPDIMGGDADTNFINAEDVFDDSGVVKPGCEDIVKNAVFMLPDGTRCTLEDLMQSNTIAPGIFSGGSQDEGSVSIPLQTPLPVPEAFMFKGVEVVTGKTYTAHINGMDHPVSIQGSQLFRIQDDPDHILGLYNSSYYHINTVTPLIINPAPPLHNTNNTMTIYQITFNTIQEGPLKGVPLCTKGYPLRAGPYGHFLYPLNDIGEVVGPDGKALPIASDGKAKWPTDKEGAPICPKRYKVPLGPDGYPILPDGRPFEPCGRSPMDSTKGPRLAMGPGNVTLYPINNEGISCDLAGRPFALLSDGRPCWPCNANGSPVDAADKPVRLGKDGYPIDLKGRFLSPGGCIVIKTKMPYPAEKEIPLPGFIAPLVSLGDSVVTIPFSAIFDADEKVKEEYKMMLNVKDATIAVPFKFMEHAPDHVFKTIVTSPVASPGCGSPGRGCSHGSPFKPYSPAITSHYHHSSPKATYQEYVAKYHHVRNTAPTTTNRTSPYNPYDYNSQPQRPVQQQHVSPYGPQEHHHTSPYDAQTFYKSSPRPTWGEKTTTKRVPVLCKHHSPVQSSPSKPCPHPIHRSPGRYKNNPEKQAMYNSPYNSPTTCAHGYPSPSSVVGSPKTETYNNTRTDTYNNNTRTDTYTNRSDNTNTKTETYKSSSPGRAELYKGYEVPGTPTTSQHVTTDFPTTNTSASVSEKQRRITPFYAVYLHNEFLIQLLPRSGLRSSPRELFTVKAPQGAPATMARTFSVERIDQPAITDKTFIIQIAQENPPSEAQVSVVKKEILSIHSTASILTEAQFRTLASTFSATGERPIMVRVEAGQEPHFYRYVEELVQQGCSKPSKGQRDTGHNVNQYHNDLIIPC